MNVTKIDDNIFEIPPKTLMTRLKGNIEKFQMKVPVKLLSKFINMIQVILLMIINQIRGIVL